MKTGFKTILDLFTPQTMIFWESLQHCFRTNWSLRGNSRTNWSNLMEYHCILLAKSQDCMRARQIYYYTATIWLIRLKILVKSYSKRKNSCGPISTRQLSSRTILKKIRVCMAGYYILRLKL